MSQILVDKHEPREIVEGLKLNNIKVEVVDLKVGDDLVESLCIERKEINDFFQSLYKRRLWNQLWAIKENYDRYALLVEGYVPRKMRTLFYSVIGRLLLNQYPVFHTYNLKDTILFLTRIALLSLQPTTRPPIIHKFKLSKEQIKRDILCMIPGIGPQTAKELLKEKKTIDNIIHSNDLRNFSNIGPKREKALKDIFLT